MAPEAVFRVRCFFASGELGGYELHFISRSSVTNKCTVLLSTDLIIFAGQSRPTEPELGRHIYSVFSVDVNSVLPYSTRVLLLQGSF